MIDMEDIRAIFEDKSTHIALATILKLELAQDRSCLKAKVSVLPEQGEMIARMTWDSVGPDSGIFQFPSVGDLVLIEFADKDPDQCFVTRRLTSREDKIPLQAVGGDLAMIALKDKKVWITSNNKIFLSKGIGEPAEPLVLGNQMKTLVSFILQTLATLTEKVMNHRHMGNLGYPTMPPVTATEFLEIQQAFTEKKASPVDDGKILSDLAFTEKGS